MVRHQIIIILFLALVMAPLAAMAQEPTYTVTYDDQPIESVLKDITRRSGYEFVYQKAVIQGAPHVTAILNNATLQQLLNRTVVAQCRLEYELVKKTIVLRKSSAKSRFVKRTVTGMVVDDENNLLPGVSVRLRGTNEGVVTDIDGQFAIMVEGNDPVLDFSYMGMKPVSIHVSAKNEKLMAVTMQTQDNLMNEVLVTGYQNIKRENATGAYQLISSKALEQRYTGDVLSNLEGRVPGLVSYNNGMNDGGESALSIRGVGSFNARTSPLVVVDGLPVEGGLASVNPYNIENITVLKDAAAASIYGARASNGVIVITTKRAQNDRLDIDFSADLTLSQKNDYSTMHWADAAQLINHQSKAAIIYHPAQPLNTISRILVAVPLYAEKEHDFISCFGLVRRLSSQIGAKVVFFTNEESQKVLQAFCRRKGKYLRAAYREMENWEDVLMIAKQMAPDDMIVMINARPSTPSYNPLFEQVPTMLEKFFKEHSYMVVYPEQETGNAVPDILTGDAPQASRTWKIISWVKAKVLSFQQR